MRSSELPQGEAKAVAVRRMFDTIAPRYDLVNAVMTFGLDSAWRRRTVGALGLAKGATVLDLAAGTGDLSLLLGHAGYRPVAVDFSLGMLQAATTDAPLVQADILRLPVADGTIDGAACGFALRNLVDLDVFFAELARALRPGGRVALLEVAIPPNALMRRGHAVYFGKVVPLIGGLLSDGSAYRYLPKSVAYLPEPEQMLEMLGQAGFVDVNRILLSGGISQLLVGTRGPSA